MSRIVTLPLLLVALLLPSGCATVDPVETDVLSSGAYETAIDAKMYRKPGSDSLMTVVSGTTVSLLQQEGEWTQIELSNNLRGWVARDAIGRPVTVQAVATPTNPPRRATRPRIVREPVTTASPREAEITQDPPAPEPKTPDPTTAGESSNPVPAPSPQPEIETPAVPAPLPTPSPPPRPKLLQPEAPVDLPPLPAPQMRVDEIPLSPP